MLELVTASPLWAPKGVADDADSLVAFRSKFVAATPRTKLKILGASAYLVWLDGKLVHDGPARFAKAFPEYQTVELATPSGSHTLAVQVHNEGVTTRILSQMQPFLWAELDAGQPLTWKCSRLPGYRPRTKRISDILGWIDWNDTRETWPNWQGASFDDKTWGTPVRVDPGIGHITAAKTRPVRLIERKCIPIAKGEFAVEYGYEGDDPAARFFLDNLSPKDHPKQGVWRRYDLGRVRLGRPSFTIDAPQGSVVEFAYSERLIQGRVSPWITLSGSPSCNFDHFVARGGRQEFMPFTPKGGRYVEVHVKAQGQVKFLKEAFLERTYFGEPIGSFRCDDALLNSVWETGVQTMRACSEDSFVDCPTRERGQWTGDVASVATDIAAVAYGDLSLSRRALVQAAQAARADGLVAGVGPGDPGYLSTYAAQWVTACVHYWELTGDRSMLVDLLPAARRNLGAISSKLTADGVSDDLGWGFVDWGYVRNDGPTDMALNAHVLRALRDMARWEDAVGDSSHARGVREKSDQLQSLITKWMKTQLARSGRWSNVGYHRASLALLSGLVDPKEKKACINFIKQHVLACFPNNTSGPRLSDPSVAHDRIFTPYFAHFAFSALFQEGEGRFVLDQYRTCWGWALRQATTWLEVFDTRWSHCHEWSGCPTWQMSRFVLGVQPRFDLGKNTFQVNVQPSGLKRASGRVPLASGQTAELTWTRSGRNVRVQVRSPEPLTILGKGRALRDVTSVSLTLPVRSSR